jgi:molybdate transport system substrate-binding protein
VDLPGVAVLGPLPGAAAITTVFSGAVLAGSAHPGSALEALDVLASQEVEMRVIAAGMTRA